MILRLVDLVIEDQGMVPDYESSEQSKGDIEDEQRRQEELQFDGVPWLSPFVNCYQSPGNQSSPPPRVMKQNPISSLPPAIQRKEKSVTNCICSLNLTEHLCQLQAIANHERPVRLDTMLIHSQRVLHPISCFLHCSFYSSNAQAFFLTSMLFSKLLELASSSIHPCQELIPQPMI